MNEFEKEYYESPDFWNDGAVNDPSNRQRIESTIDLIPQDVSSLVDIGCGNGVFLNRLIDRNKTLEVLGVDRSNEALKHLKCDSKIGDIINLPIESNSYDCVSCLQVLEHIPVRDYEKALSELARISKKYIIVGVPFEEEIDKNMTKCPQCKTQFNVDLHLRSYDVLDIKNLFENHNLSCKEYTNVVEKKEYLLLSSLIKFKESFKEKNKKEYFRSPLCPLCGFQNKNPEFFKPVQTAAPKSPSDVKRKITSIIKLLSPTRMNSGYWIIALYEKN